ncbi:MAG: thioredoxin domain-containing protein [Planctomycetes bacterium]|nr:thioredoxin domain-containing protein [Planctomycetota bacterium]
MRDNARPQKNRLAKEASPYLLQHATNPVDWHPWGDEAFALARRLDKPVFLSIGYSTCHWCHVMAHESFEDPEVAKLLNEAFVCVKVDREERPDVDGVYMAVCQALTGGGGWPLTIVMTPDKKPFFAGTYFPKEGRFGRPGLLELIPRISETWRTRREHVAKSAERIAEALRRVDRPSGAEEGVRRGAAGHQEVGVETLQAAAGQLAERFDPQHGGFGDAPKFPTPHNLAFLLRHWRRSGDQHALAMADRTLDAMRLGGIWDHVGFGFHRYSTDARWLVPHFEKMLYDQALLALAYTEAFQATGKPAHRETARDILAYVLRDMTAPEGGFWSAEDADSEGEEGKFYLWSVPEVAKLVGPEDAGLAIKLLNLAPEGNFVDQVHGVRTGMNIPHLAAPVAVEHRERFEAIRQRLFAAREKRVRPHKDDKVLTDWNGLMIAALARAAQAFGEPRYAEAAERAAAFALKELRRPDGRLRHCWVAQASRLWPTGKMPVPPGRASAAPAHADDYAFLTWGLLDLYEATFSVRWLEAALELNRLLLAHHWDDAAGGLFFTADDGEKLLFRQKELYDGAAPSANSVALSNLLRLSRVTGHASLEDRAARLTRAFAADVARMPSAFTQFLCGLDFALGPSHEAVIAGRPGAPDTLAMLAAIRTSFLPNKVLLFRPADEAAPAIARLAPYTAAQVPLDGKATAYVCQAGACKAPTTDPAEALAALRR